MIESKAMTFDEIAKDAGDAEEFPVEIHGATWTMKYPRNDLLRRLERAVAAGKATIIASSSASKYTLEISIAPRIDRHGVFDSVEEAARAADEVKADYVEHAGHKWFSTESLSPTSEKRSKTWLACISNTDVAELRQSYVDGTFTMTRTIRPRDGHTYEVSASRYREQAVTNFAEACAIVLTLPAYVGALAETKAP